MYLIQFCRAIATLALALSLLGCGVTASSNNAGYADLDSLGFKDVDTTMSLSLGSSILHFASSNMEDDPAARILLRNLDGVRVKTYDIVGDGARVLDRIDKMSQKLQKQGWEPVITVREEGERTVLLMKTRGQRIVGLTVINCDAVEAVVVNVMGDLRPEMFAETIRLTDRHSS
jgi:hypothetical protein